MDRKHEIEKYLMQLLPEEPEEITATSLKREYTNGFLAGQRKAYDECDDIARELSQIKSGCSKWLDEHDRKIRNDAIDECSVKVAGLLAYYEQSDDEYHYTNWIEKDIKELQDEIEQMKEDSKK